MTKHLEIISNLAPCEAYVVKTGTSFLLECSHCHPAVCQEPSFEWFELASFHTHQRPGIEWITGKENVAGLGQRFPRSSSFPWRLPGTCWPPCITASLEDSRYPFEEPGRTMEVFFIPCHKLEHFPRPRQRNFSIMVRAARWCVRIKICKKSMAQTSGW